ncbi:MAG: hypothetical protein LBJ74_05875 [Heliobacteriaceae bacterium]|jgi:hypothetical protein|nr:hypothetical protein [Heliobacteriaceae bacterium]
MKINTDITQIVRKTFHTPAEFEQILGNNRYLGWIPQELAGTEKLLSDFAQDMFEVRNYDSDGIQKVIERLGKKLKAKYLSEGGFGVTTLIDAGKKLFVCKTFREKPTVEFRSGSGKRAEILNACFADENADKYRFPPFFFGKYARRKDKDGYLVTEFIDKNNALKLNWKTKYLYDCSQYVSSHDIHRLGDDDKPMSDNIIGDTIIEFGDIDVRTQLEDLKKRGLVKSLFEAVDRADKKQIKMLKAQYSNDEIENAVQYIDSCFDPIIRFFNLPEETRALMHKIGVKPDERFITDFFNLF